MTLNQLDAFLTQTQGRYQVQWLTSGDDKAEPRLSVEQAP
jgi:hypothetical protein